MSKEILILVDALAREKNVDRDLEIIHCYWMVFKYQVCILSSNKYTLQAQNHVGYIALMLMFVYRSLDSSVGRAGDCSWSNQGRYL